MQVSRSPFLVLATLLAGAASAQNFLYMPASRAPQTQELGSFRIVPLMRPSARTQMFYDATEAGSASFLATGLALRYDGPIPPVGAPGPFTIQRLTIAVGTTTRAIPGPDFAANLTQPLTTVFDGPVTYWPDQGTSGPEPWGAANDRLNFPFTQPVQIAVPAGGFFVVDLTIDGNGLNGQAHTMLDAALGAGGPVDGIVSNRGVGCSVTTGGTNATISTSGIHAPGGVHSIWGDALGANSPVFAMIGGSDTTAPFGPLPLLLPGTACHIYTSSDVMLPLRADGAGSLAPFARGSTVAIPALSLFQGAVLFEQLAAYVPGANPFNLVLSDERVVQLGTLTPISPGFYAVSHGFDAAAPIADDAGPHGYALRVQTQ
ncbi:MAG: hypothetical protein R3F56_17930 [Planctomycetota bacterium]